MNAPQPLTTSFVKSLTVTKQRRFTDGPRANGLALLARASRYDGIRRFWIQEIRVGNGPVKRRTTLGLGTFPEVSLAEARTRAAENAIAVKRGHAPVHGLRGGNAHVLTHQAAGSVTFAIALEGLIDTLKGGWKSQDNGVKRTARTEDDWRKSMKKYALPMLGSKRMDELTSRDVLAVLEPVWHEKRARAATIAQRIGKVCAWAVGKGYASRNVAVEAVAALPKHATEATEHRAAVPYAAVPRVVSEIHSLDEKYRSFALALELTILTGLRTSSVGEARWEEFDFTARTWTVPAARMKGRHAKAFRVPITDVVMDCLDRIREDGGWEGFLFTNLNRTKKLPDDAMRRVLAMIEACDVHGEPATVHGFRSSFRDWACEVRGEDRLIAEMCLAHNTRGDVERAYSRSDLLERRRDVMQAWGEYIAI